MKYVFNKTCIGYNHIDNNTVCQDFSDTYQDDERIIIVTADGHGGKLYVRSDKGSRFACQAIMDVFKKLKIKPEFEYSDARERSIKLKLISKWNELVEKDYANNPFKSYELENLSEYELDRLKDNFVYAYGTTLNAVLITKEFVLCVSIGDGGLFIISENSVEPAIVDVEEEQVGNLTYSLCGEDAYNHIHVECYCNDSDVVGLICLTDGVINPYQSYENFTASFLDPMVKLIKDEGDSGVEKIKKFIKNLGVSTGIGDDVSIAVYLNLPDKEEFEEAKVEVVGEAIDTLIEELNEEEIDNVKEETYEE